MVYGPSECGGCEEPDMENNDSRLKKEEVKLDALSSLTLELQQTIDRCVYMYLHVYTYVIK